MLLHLAAALILLLGIAHSYLGERYLLIRLAKRDNLPKVLGSAEMTIGTLRFVWHLLTVAWFGIAAAILLAAGPTVDSRSLLRVLSVTVAVTGVLPLYFTRGRHLSWIVCFVIAALLWAGS